jgi:hypothetical protein
MKLLKDIYLAGDFVINPAEIPGVRAGQKTTMSHGQHVMSEADAVMCFA